MTFLDKLKSKYPDSWEHKSISCPWFFGYEDANDKPCTYHKADEFSCVACWLREDPSTTESPTNDAVNHPAHYTNGGIECIDAITAALSAQSDPVDAWLTGQIIKYLWRWPLKNGKEDLEKARFYLNRLIDRQEDADDER